MAARSESCRGGHSTSSVPTTMPRTCAGIGMRQAAPTAARSTEPHPDPLVLRPLRRSAEVPSSALATTWPCRPPDFLSRPPTAPHRELLAPRGPTCAGRPVRGVATFADELAGHGGGQVHRAGLSRQHAAQRRPGARQSGIRDHRRLHKGQQLAGRVGVLQGARQQRSLILGGQGSGCDHRSMSHTSGMW